MTDRQQVLMATVMGAAIGAVAGYLFLTEHGRRLRDQIEPKLDEAMQEINRLRQAVSKAQLVATEGWRSLTQMAGEARRGEWSGARQSSPF